MKILLVGGKFDDEGGRPSGYIDKLYEAFTALSVETVQCFNGGAYESLPVIIEGVVTMDYDAVIWFAEVPNGMEKLAHKIKQANPKCILVTSKRNEYVNDRLGEPKREYSFQAVIAHALRLKSNLLVEFFRVAGSVLGPETTKGKRAVCAQIYDPLGNSYTPAALTDIYQVARVLVARIRDLRKFTRIRSVRVGDAIEVPNREEFFALTKKYAEKFHEVLDPQQTDRFLGNASFRCDKGFPSFKHGDLIFVSRRNVDKRYIGPDAFVAVNADVTHEVQYYGEHKPSVDTPIQLRLYRYYKNVNYMLHGHVYVKDALRTAAPYPIPCGAIEEVDYLTRFSRSRTGGHVNIEHHGCLLMGEDVETLAAADFVQRPAPETVTVY